MSVNLRKNVIAICTAISFSLLSYLALAADELTDNGELRKRQAGIVYKSDNFWDKYDTFHVMKLIFQGEFDDNASSRSSQFKDDYLKFVEVNSMLCGNSIPSNHFAITTTTQRVHMVGGMESYRDEPVSITIKMEDRFKDRYLEYKNDRKRNLMEDNAIKSNFFQMFKMSKLSLEKPHKSYFERGSKGLNRRFNATDRHQIMGRFFREVTCQSATLYQMKENLWRAAHGQPSLQSDKIEIPSAVQESISEEKAALEVTFYESCLVNYNVEPESEYTFCRCLDNTTRHVMEGNERDYYSANFSRFLSDADGKELTPKDSLWRLHLPLNYCTETVLNRYMTDEDRMRKKQVAISEQRAKKWLEDRIKEGQEPQHIKDERKAKQKRAEELAKARAEKKAKKATAREELLLENERAIKAAKKKNEEYNVAWQALIKQREKKLQKLDAEYREKMGIPPRRDRTQAKSREERKAQALAYAEARKNTQQVAISRKEGKAVVLAYREARKKV
ncbi:MAG: hypothetical protein KUG78_20895, partial [Kangiellaceae bacterium]|nr:hypothetical protein [Kangiellaceae bacterium]